MPELPEVETIVRQLAPLMKGAEVRSARIFDPKLRQARVRTLCGKKVCDVFREGKYIVFALRGSKKSLDEYLSVHLRMSGNLVWCEAREGESWPNEGEIFRFFDRRHLRAKFVFDVGTLLFIDPRRFGTLTRHRRLNELGVLGLDPLSREFVPQRLDELIGISRQEVKVWLIRQDRLVGIGNIYASEILFSAGISPRRRVDSLTGEETTRLCRSTKRVLRAAIKRNGTSFSDFRGITAESGSFQRFLKVYGREGEPCRSCITPVKRIVQQGRSSFYCGSCQR